MYTRRYAIMRISAVVALLLPLTLAAQEPVQTDWRFAHPDATLVGGFRPAAILNSPLFQSAWTGAQVGDPAAAAMVGMATKALSGITEVRFSLMDNGTPEPDVIALIRGQFDEELLGMLGQAKAKYQRIDANTFLFGNGDSLNRAAARMTQSTPVLQARASEGTESLSGYDLWISGKVPNLPAAGLNMVDGLKLNLRGVALGLSIHDNLEAELALETATAEMAASLIHSAHEAEVMQPAKFQGLLKSMVDGATAHFRLNIPRELAIEAMRTRMAPPAPAPLQPLAEAPKPRRQTIVIQGLEGGPREIPLQ